MRARAKAAAAAAPPPAPIPDPKPGCTAPPATLEANKKLVMSSLDRTTKDAGAPPRTVEMVVAECDYVSVVWKQVLPDPDTPSRTWEAFTFDTFRIAGGRLAQHWDGATR